ncbi:MAG TPA: SGNH hydrolase domain-containing protein, partial [Acidimicrobiales bacterium]|nr:SGNH hydrolase domain-containing protein [Acidimicrobiales bacterium]
SGAALLAARVAVTFALAVACHELIDEPVRQRTPRTLPRLAAPALAAVALTASIALVGAAVAPPPATRPARARLAAAVRAPVGTAPAPAPAPGPAGVPLLSVAAAAATAPLPPTAAPQPALAGAPAAPVHAVLLGDSVALTLGDGLLDRQSGSGVDVVDGGLIGCGVMGAGEVRVGGVASFETAGCANWETGWRDLLGQVRPAVVAVLVGRWEVVDRVVAGRWSHIGEPAFDAALSAGLDRAITAAASTGGRVVLLTAPYFAGVERPNGGAWPEDDPARVDRFNALLRAAAARAPGDVSVFDLGALADPDGRYTPVLNGLTARRADGVHFTEAGADLLAPAVLKALAP